MEKKDQELHFFVTKSDQERIHQKMAEMGIHSKSAYLPKNGTGRLLREAGSAGCEGTGFSPAPLQQPT